MADLAGKRVYVAGHCGMVGSALLRRLASEDCQILTAAREELDLRRQADVEEWMRQNRPNVIFLAAATVGGILANEKYPVDFLYDNTMIGMNVIRAAHSAGVGKLLFLGSSCIYPRLAEQPIVEEALLSGSLEPTNEAYALAKIACLRLCQAYRRQYGADFIAAMPTNLYGPGDNYDLRSSHVLPALIRKAHEAKLAGLREMTLWGSGKPRREFMHVDDCADACVRLMQRYSAMAPVNVGVGEDIAILDLARLVCKVVGFTGALSLDGTKADGTPRKLLNIERLRRLGWTPSIGLEEGIDDTYRSFLSGDCRERRLEAAA